MKRKENNHYYIYIIMILIGILIFFLTILVCWQIIAAIIPFRLGPLRFVPLRLGPLRLGPLRLGPLREGLESAESPVEATVTPVEAPASTSPVYQPYNAEALSNNAAALPKQNATNIDYLNGQIMTLNSSNTKNQKSISSMQTQIDSLTEQQVKYAQSIGTPATT